MRHQAREIALQILFQKEFGVPIKLEDMTQMFAGHVEEDSLKYAHVLVSGVDLHQEAIDQKISQQSAHWTMARMALVDKNVLRLATYELLFSEDPPPKKVIINEAVELAKKYGSTDSGSFVNGILDALRH